MTYIARERGACDGNDDTHLPAFDPLDPPRRTAHARLVLAFSLLDCASADCGDGRGGGSGGGEGRAPKRQRGASSPDEPLASQQRADASEQAAEQVALALPVLRQALGDAHPSVAGARVLQRRLAQSR